MNAERLAEIRDRMKWAAQLNNEGGCPECKTLELYAADVGELLAATDGIYEGLLNQEAEIADLRAKLAVHDDIARRVVEAGGLPKPVYGESPLTPIGGGVPRCDCGCADGDLHTAACAKIVAIKAACEKSAAAIRRDTERDWAAPLTPGVVHYNPMTTTGTAPCGHSLIGLMFTEHEANVTCPRCREMLDSRRTALERVKSHVVTMASVANADPVIALYEDRLADGNPVRFRSQDAGLTWQLVSDPEDDDEEDDDIHTPHPHGPDIGESGASSVAAFIRKSEEAWVAHGSLSPMSIRAGEMLDLSDKMTLGAGWQWAERKVSREHVGNAEDFRDCKVGDIMPYTVDQVIIGYDEDRPNAACILWTRRIENIPPPVAKVPAPALCIMDEATVLPDDYWEKLKAMHACKCVSLLNGHEPGCPSAVKPIE